MSKLKRILDQYEVEDNSQLPKVSIKGKGYFYNKGRDQYISVDNQNIVVSGERIRKANIQVEEFKK